MGARITKADWSIINDALTYYEAGGYAVEEMGEDDPPEGFRSWSAYIEQAEATRRKVWARLDGRGGVDEGSEDRR